MDPAGRIDDAFLRIVVHPGGSHVVLAAAHALRPAGRVDGLVLDQPSQAETRERLARNNFV